MPEGKQVVQHSSGDGMLEGVPFISFFVDLFKKPFRILF